MAKVVPGLAFWLICDLGFAVGLTTHRLERIGDLVWLAEPVFEEEPDLADVISIQQWRWPVLVPLGSMLHHKIIHRIGIVEVPATLKSLPLMRSGNKKSGWREVRLSEHGSTRPLGRTSDASLPIYRIVNYVRLTEMLVSGWTPERDW